MSTIETNHTNDLNEGPETNNVTTDSTNTTTNESEKFDETTAATTTTVRKRTRATVEQLSVLEDTFAANVSPNSKLRKELSERLQMSERSIQIWFQNRRAKVKHVQKRAQMQMQQASIRAQLYHYHQQQYGMQSYGGGAPIMPVPQHQQMYPPRMPLPRSSSMDPSHQHHHTPLPTPPASTSSCTSSASPNTAMNPSIPQTHQLSYPSSQDNTMEFPDYLHGGPLSPSLSPHHGYALSHPPSLVESPTGTPSSSSSMPSLVAVPDAGPTAMLATASSASSSSSTSDPLVSTPATPPSCVADQTTVSPQDIWPASVHQSEHMMRSQSVSMQRVNEACTDPLERSLSNPPMTTIDPSNLMMNTNNDTTNQQQRQQQQHEPTTPPSSSATTDVYLNCTTLTIGTWHRLKLRASDLLCTFKRNTNTFEWQIEDGGCHFKMEIALSSIANIDFVQENNMLADVHFDISESPLFYMETTNNWIQCSDFTEGKQASRFFRHSLKGVSQHLKQDLMTLMDQCPETRRWIRFVEPIHPHQYASPQYPHAAYPKQQQQQQYPYSAPVGMVEMQPYPPVTYHHHHHQDAFMNGEMSYPTNDHMTFSPSMYIPPPPSNWSPMYQPSLPTQTPVMMGTTHPLV